MFFWGTSWVLITRHTRNLLSPSIVLCKNSTPFSLSQNTDVSPTSDFRFLKRGPILSGIAGQRKRREGDVSSCSRRVGWFAVNGRREAGGVCILFWPLPLPVCVVVVDVGVDARFVRAIPNEEKKSRFVIFLS